MTTRYSDLVFAVTRVMLAFLYFCHGAQKLLGVFGGHGIPRQPLFLAGGIIEVLGGVLIAIGLGTRVVAFLCSGEMAVAYFHYHFPHSFWPIVNHGELAVALCFFFLYLAARGAGQYSVDALLHRGKVSPIRS